jgi:16S rRNA (uracil1498-N3)-methyltransferase
MLHDGSEISVDGDKARYLGKVLRLKAGDHISVFNGNDGEHSATLTRSGKNRVTIAIGAPVPTTTESPLRIHLVQGISRGERMDIVVQKATELGVKRITPVLTEYGVVKLAADRRAKRHEHWQKVAISACEQSGRVRPPLVEAPLTLKEWFGQRSGAADTDLILRPGACTPLASVAAPANKVCLLIGPEGGFSQTEYEDAGIAGFAPVSLGPRILRTETAAIAALSVAQATWGDL